MKLIKYMLIMSCSLLLMTACEKDNTGDTSFVETTVAPDALALTFDITQDNTGKVTITPNSNGAVTYSVYFGDGTIAPAGVYPGKSAQHNYAEGAYTVRVVAHGAGGQTTEITKPLTVTFRVPENFVAVTDIDASNNYKLNVSAEALYETNFRVTFGDAPNEVPRSFLQGETVNHVYTATGSYTVKIVAVSGGAATAEIIRTINIVDPVLLPLSFESPTLNYAFANFDGGNSTVISNPQVSGINTSTKVVRMIKNAGQSWGGSLIPLSSPIDFSTNKFFRMKVFSPRVGARVLLKVENATNNGINFEKEVTTTVANKWDDLVFDYSSINTTNQYHKIVLIFDNGTAGDGSPNFTFLLDDIRLEATPGITFPVTFENALIVNDWGGFGGANAGVINNPQSSGINTSAKVGRMIKGAPETWAGAFTSMSVPINFVSGANTIKMKVYSPRIGARILFKVENLTNGGIAMENEQTTTVANAWQELTFTFNVNTANSYQKIVLFMDNGNAGDGSPNFTFLFDDITLN
ncbi:MAG: hypothetical protein H7Y86_10060 [Rhizobacter sp.]|nr:hypothetical protein [Ferruginibacter sp.]